MWLCQRRHCDVIAHEPGYGLLSHGNNQNFGSSLISKEDLSPRGDWNNQRHSVTNPH